MESNQLGQEAAAAKKAPAKVDAMEVEAAENRDNGKVVAAVEMPDNGQVIAATAMNPDNGSTTAGTKKVAAKKGKKTPAKAKKPPAKSWLRRLRPRK